MSDVFVLLTYPLSNYSLNAVVEKLSIADYDKLSPEEQKAHDKALADQEAAEQAGALIILISFTTLLTCFYP